jgi:hypothetical protein
VWHATCTQGSRGNSEPSFGHNLCFKCPNGSCEPILEIYIPRFFQWYKELFNPMGFDPCNPFLKILESIGTLTPKVGAHLRVWGFIHSHSPTLLEQKCDSRASHLTYTFASLYLDHKPKAKVATSTYWLHFLCFWIKISPIRQIMIEFVWGYS